MLGPYAVALRTPGARAFSAAGLVARLPMSMFGLAIVFAVEASTGAYGQAGLASGAALLGQAAASPVQARLADRWGQRRMLVPVLGAHATAMGVLAAALGRVPLWAVVALAAAAGATLPQFGALVRARWARLGTDTPILHTAYALESVLDEVVFVVGPPVVTLLATGFHPLSGLALCVVLTLLGGTLFAAQRATDPGPRTPESADTPTAPFPVVLISWLAVVFAFMGGIFGSVEVTTVAFAEELGTPGAAGLILAVFAFGSMLAGVIAGAIRWSSTARRRFVVGQAVLAVAVLPLPFVDTAVLMAVAGFVAGFAISPTLIAGFSLIEAEVPAARLTEGLAWASTALSAGVALGAAAAGPIIDDVSASAAYGVAVGCGLLATVGCAVGITVERARRRAARRETV